MSDTAAAAQAWFTDDAVDLGSLAKNQPLGAAMARFTRSGAGDNRETWPAPTRLTPVLVRAA
ncbi:MAG TPA: hypothetical protein VG166_09855 [Caulobacteraceae bacterium]|jgi:hypothetical protein|nr:hypothetical protein [Caulobacteraceae bacterium]